MKVKNEYRTHMCGELNIKNLNESVILSGWIQTIRNLGAMKFIDLRDETGITQIVIKDSRKDLLEQSNDLCTETVIKVEGIVIERSSKNDKIPTGEIEIDCDKIEVLGKAKNSLPFETNSEKIELANVAEDLRLQYRFLELRNSKLHETIKFRSEVMKYLRAKMDDLGFTEIQTPILANSSPEGARDYLVPSRIHKGEFYALPQAPQQFKQLLMVSGFNRYYQICPCFRDEDPRADRAPGEFYQLDFEMSFATQEDVLSVLEDIFYSTFTHFTKWNVSKPPFERIPYREAMEKYGSDKPDLRNPLMIKDVSSIFENSEFNAFKGKVVKAIVIPKGAEQGRKFYDRLTEFAKIECGAEGMAWIKLEETAKVENATVDLNGTTVTGGISKFITKEMLEKLTNKYEAKLGDSVIFVASDKLLTVQKIAGALRIEVGNELDLLEKDSYRWCFIVDFPMYEYNEEEEKVDFNHNPFSMPQGGMEALNSKDPLDILAFQYDAVCNGYEMASGAVRNHNPEIMKKAFEIAGYEEKDVITKFGALYNAFQYGTPPHAGAAPGFDRMLMLLRNTTNIREVIAFPKNKKARDLLMNAPSTVNEQQLKDVHIEIRKEEEKEEK